MSGLGGRVIADFREILLDGKKDEGIMKGRIVTKLAFRFAQQETRHYALQVKQMLDGRFAQKGE